MLFFSIIVFVFCDFLIFLCLCCFFVCVSFQKNKRVSIYNLPIIDALQITSLNDHFINSTTFKGMPGIAVWVPLMFDPIKTTVCSANEGYIGIKVECLLSQCDQRLIYLLGKLCVCGFFLVALFLVAFYLFIFFFRWVVCCKYFLGESILEFHMDTIYR